MDKRDIIVTALTPGSPFNVNGKIWRSTGVLAAFCDCEIEEVMEHLAGDLAQQITCKPSTKGKGILVALTANIPAQDEQVVVAGGPAMNEPPVQAEGEAEEAIPHPEVEALVGAVETLVDAAEAGVPVAEELEVPGPEN